MESNLLSCTKLEIPDALVLDHEALRAGLARAANEPGPIGKAAERVALLCREHFAEEEKIVSRAFAQLHDPAWIGGRGVAAAIARFTARHLALREHHQSINAAVEELLQAARKDGNGEIAELVSSLRHHERIENVVLYPTMLFIGSSVRDSLRV